ncbi:MAG: HAMP domain-containing sensor histidine kinase [Erysipelotrichaceae bacterium]
MSPFQSIQRKLIFVLCLLIFFISLLYNEDFLIHLCISLLLVLCVVTYAAISTFYFNKHIQTSFEETQDNIKALKNLNFDDLTQEQFKEIYQSFHEMDENYHQYNAYLSHELKNKLAVLLSMIQADRDKAEIIASIVETDNSIENLQALSVHQSASLNEQVDLSLLCAEIVDTYRISYQNIDFDFETVPLIKSKSFLIHSAISNLIDNAIKYGNKSQISVRVYNVENAINITIKDYGQGIDEDFVHALFDVHARFNLQSKNSYGVGLSIVKNVMSIMNGFIWVESEKDKYTTFILSFPTC